ncbi:DUF397 domain-containing protein [Streptomyces sp. NPDC020681]
MEAATLSDATLAIRDSKDIARDALHFSHQAWSRFLTAVQAESVG